ncbi:unnamed protein product [Rotaria sp. Silwood1]|nr:unnamed protein product [Rotaria sp. Silwood1]
MTYDERSSLNSFKEQEHIIEDFSEDLPGTNEEEIEILSTDDLQNDLKCSITILASGIFPRCDLVSESSKNLFTQSVCTSDQDSDFSNYNVAQETTILTTSNGFQCDSFGFTDRQVPPTPPTNQSDNSLLAPTSLMLPRKQRYQTRLYRPRIVRRLACDRQKTPKQRTIQYYLNKFECLTHRVNRLYKRIDRILECYLSTPESEL